MQSSSHSSAEIAYRRIYIYCKKYKGPKKWAPVTVLEQSLEVKLLSCYFSFDIEHFLWDCGCEAATSFISGIFHSSFHLIVQARHVAEDVTVKGYYPVRCCAVPIFLVQLRYTTSGWVQSVDTWWHDVTRDTCQHLHLTLRTWRNICTRDTCSHLHKHHNYEQEPGAWSNGALFGVSETKGVTFSKWPLAFKQVHDHPWWGIRPCSWATQVVQRG